VRNPDGSLVRAGLAVSGQTFAVGSYTTGGCPSPPPDVPPAVVLTLRLEVTADNGAGTLTGNLTPEPSLYCPLAVQTCSVDPTPLWRP
jgi:hypothetical protein